MISFYKLGLPSNQTINVRSLSFNMSMLDIELYTATTAALLQYCKNILSTRAIAVYVTNIMLVNHNYEYGQSLTTENQNMTKNFTAQISNSGVKPKSILFLTHQYEDMDKGDYQVDFLLHGLIKLFGRNAVVDYPRRNVLYKTKNEFTGEQYHKRRKRMYGYGFSFGLLLDEFEDRIAKNQTSMYYMVNKMIDERSFDLIILGSGHRDGYASKLHFWDKICNLYPPHKVAWIDGGDPHVPPNIVRLYSKCADHLFSREGPAQRYTIL